MNSIDIEKVENYLKGKHGTEDAGYLDNDEFMSLMSDLLISKNGYIADYCTVARANWIIIELLLEKIKRHPRLWKWFFMVA